MEARIEFLKGKKVILRPIDKEKDKEAFTRWINDPGLRCFIMKDIPTTLEQEEKWIDGVNSDKGDKVNLAIVAKDSDELIGNISLGKIDYRHGTATTGTIIGEKNYHGKGYGSDAKMTFLNYAFNTLNLRKVKSSVFDYNGRSLKYSFKCGYVIEGIRKKQFFKEGDYRDEIILAVFKDRWQKVWEEYQKTGKLIRVDFQRIEKQLEKLRTFLGNQ